MEGYRVRVLEDYCEVILNNDAEEKEWGDKTPYKHYLILDELFEFMRCRGFEVVVHPRTLKEYPSIAENYFYGKKGDLEFKAERYPAGFKIEFYQNIVFENNNGGEYDFYKYEKMPYMLKLMVRNETSKIVQFLKQKDVQDNTETKYKLAEDKIKQYYVKSWNHPQKDMNFRLSDLDGATGKPTYNTKDRDGNEVLNGQIKYFRDYDGRLMRCKAYHNINNMWWCIISDTECTNKASFELFDATEDDFKNRRVVRDDRPRFQYAVITSQYGYSYHSFICRFDKDTFMDNAKALVRELIQYREGTERTLDKDDLGDLTYHKKKTIRAKYNINANGDIYFRNKDTIEEARSTVEMWQKEAKESRRAFRRKGMSEAIRKHHNPKKIEALVSKYFEIVE